MINMENRDEILKKHTELNKIQLTNPHYTVGGIKNGIKTSGTFVLFEDVPHAMQEYSDQQNKQLLDEIERLKRVICEKYDSLIVVKNNEIAKLQFELKAADSVNENLSKQEEWISVEDRLPEINGMYLVFTDFVDVATIRSFSIELGCLYVHITQWMPLPNQPK